MDKQELMKQYQKEEDKFLAAKILNKVQFTNSKNQIQTTDFLDGYQQKIAKKVLQQINFINAIFYGGYEEAERKMILFFPEKLQSILKQPYNQNNIIQNIIKVISITLPIDLKDQYHHRDYLSGIMKLGIKREKVGDIIVNKNGADILVQSDMISYLLTNLAELTRFKKAKIEEKSISQLKVIPIQKETINILVAQLRLDAIVAELIHSSRTKANELISDERVLVNYEIRTKNSTVLKQGDLLTIRGKGKFEIGEIEGKTSKGNIRLIIEKYVS